MKRGDPRDVVVDQGQQFIGDHDLKSASRHRWTTVPKPTNIRNAP